MIDDRGFAPPFAMRLVWWGIGLLAWMLHSAIQAEEVPADPVPPCTDGAWRTPLVQHWTAPAVRRAESYAKTPLPTWDLDAYMEFSRSGRREAGERMLRQRLEPLSALVIAECSEQHGRFIPAIERTLDGLVLQPAWTLPAADTDLANLRGDFSVDLNACETAHDAAWALRLLGPQMSTAVRERLAAALEQRIFTPMRRALKQYRRGASLGPHWWIKGRSNWNAVCVSSIVGAAYASRRPDLDGWLAFGRDAIRHYLESFNGDGYSDEGPQYWNYGYGAYMRLRETLLWAEPQGDDLMEHASARAMATYPARIVMADNAVAPFGDAPSTVRIDPVKRAHGEVAVGWAEGEAWAALARPTSSGGRLAEAVWRLWGMPKKANGTTPTRPDLQCSLFPQSGVAVFRPKTAADTDRPLMITLRIGGSRAHAHDDAGSYAVAAGGALVTGDPGSPTYTKDSFGAKRRENPFVNSLGHPVPRVGGQLQRDATEFRAAWSARPCSLQSTSAREASVDLHGVYDVPGLKTLTRDVDYDEGDGRFVAFIDSFEAEKPLTFETAILVRGNVESVGGRLEIEASGVRLIMDVAASAPWEAMVETLGDHPTNRIKRVALRLRGLSTSGCIAHRFRRTNDPRPVTPIKGCGGGVEASRWID